jgi:hypothetical protein
MYNILFFLVLTVLIKVLFVNLVLKKDIKESIRSNKVLPIEIIKGTYMILEKVSTDQMIIIRHYRGNKIGSMINVAVPERMQHRIIEGRVYFIYYDYRYGEICFNDGAKHTEQSNYTAREMRKSLFPLMTKVLEKMNQ